MLKLNNPINLQELALKINANLTLLNNLDNEHSQKIITSIEVIEKAGSDQITFVANPLYAKYLENTNAAAVIIGHKYLNSKYLTKKMAVLVTNNPRLALAKLMNLCLQPKKTVANIHASCVMGHNVTIGENVILEAGVVIGDNCSIGNNTTIKANVVLYDNCSIGNNCLIHSNTVIGSDGFGFAQDEHGAWVKMPHLGGVIIEDWVEIGSNTSVDRGCIGDTIIKQGVIIDNLVQIAHNVIIGDYTAIAGCTGIAGSTCIGKRCLIGGAVSISGHLIITDEVHISATSSVNKSLLQKGVYSSGLPVNDNMIWKKNIARFNMLDQSFRKLFERIKNLEKIT
jgi:UDP-3-O-[3-hydroxymyristoyl] glucosamine N-acyltransferase